MLERILGWALGVTILLSIGSLWFADHQRSKVILSEQKLEVVEAARDEAIDAAKVAADQLKSAEVAVASAKAMQQSAAKNADVARTKIKDLAKDEKVNQVMKQEIPPDVWDAIYKKMKEK